MSIIYDLIYFILIIICAPVYLFKGKFHRGFIRRFGILPRGVKFNRPIWVHAVSVGEAMAMRGLIKELRLLYPLKNFVISTVTPTGNKIARSIALDSDFVTYLPFDLSFITSRVIKRINPCIFIIAETEIWPNLINSLYKLAIPVAVLNARISDASFKGYAAIKYLLKPTLSKVNIFCAQSQGDGVKLNALGVSLGKIEVTGNMKFDQVPEVPQDSKGYRDKLGLEEKEVLLVAGSTHKGEEKILLSAYQKLLSFFPNLRLMLAPRHPERSKEAEVLAKGLGFFTQRISELSRDGLFKEVVFILDTIGELAHFYGAADIVFVGGSLVKRGGHNILEPVFLSKPVIFGPHMFNFRDIAQEFLANGAAMQVFDQEGLISKIKELLGNKLKPEELVKNSQAVVAKNQGATMRNIYFIRKLIV